MIQMVKNYFGMRNFETNLPKISVGNEVNSPQDIADVSTMKKFVDKVMVSFRGSEQMKNDLNRKEGIVAGSVEDGVLNYTGTLEYDTRTEKPISFKAEKVYASIHSKPGLPLRMTMEFKDDGKTAAYSFTSKETALFHIDNHTWRITGTESLVMDSKTGAILEMNVPQR